jgi:hypothetical protein
MARPASSSGVIGSTKSRKAFFNTTGCFCQYFLKTRAS